MKNLFFLICINFALNISFCLAGDANRIGSNEIPINFPQCIPINSYHSIGFSNLNFAPVAELATSNPAILSTYKETMFGFQFEYFSKINNALYKSIGVERAYPFIPISFGAVYPLQNFNLGFTYNQKYSEKLDFGQIPITTIDDPEGLNGETFSPEFQKSLHSLSGIIAYPIISGNFRQNELSFGLQLSIDYLTGNETVPDATAEFDEFAYSWKVGINYSIKKQISLGVLFEKGVDISGTVHYEYENQNSEHPQDTSNVYVIRDYEPLNKLYSKSPDILAAGVSFKTLNNLLISITTSHLFWHAINSSIENQFEVSMTGIYKFQNNLYLSLGIYYTDQRSEIAKYFGGYEATYLHGGIQFPYRNGNIQLILMDSHLFSDKSRRNTTVRFGINYILNKRQM